MPLGSARFGFAGSAAAGGALEIIEKQTITSNTAAVDFDSIKGSEYDVHFLQAHNIKNATDDQQFAIRMSVGGTFDTDNDYQRAIFTISADGGTDDSRDTNINQIFFTLNQGNATNEKGHGYAYFYNLHDSSKQSFVTMQTTTINVNGNSLEFDELELKKIHFTRKSNKSN